MGRAKWSKRGICRRASIGLTNVGGAVRLKMIPCAERAQDEDMELSFRIRIDSSALLHRYRLRSQRRHRTNGKHDERCVSCETSAKRNVPNARRAVGGFGAISRQGRAFEFLGDLVWRVPVGDSRTDQAPEGVWEAGLHRAGHCYGG